MNEIVVTQSLIYDIFDVDLARGLLTWVKPPKQHPRMLGLEAGSVGPSQSGKLYWNVKIGGRRYKRSRLIFCAANGHMPTPCVDHIDGNSLNDGIANLREATVMQNAWNHKSRSKRLELPMGVRSTKAGRFAARIGVNKRQIHLGAYDTPDEAQAVYLRAREAYFGQFA